MNTSSSDNSDNSENLTSFNNTNITLSKYELPIFDKKIEIEFDGFVVINADYSKNDASVPYSLIIRNDSSQNKRDRICKKCNGTGSKDPNAQCKCSTCD